MFFEFLGWMKVRKTAGFTVQERLNNVTLWIIYFSTTKTFYNFFYQFK